jgi:hypothetical protein
LNRANKARTLAVKTNTGVEMGGLFLKINTKLKMITKEVLPYCQYQAYHIVVCRHYAADITPQSKD